MASIRRISPEESTIVFYSYKGETFCTLRGNMNHNIDKFMQDKFDVILKLISMGFTSWQYTAPGITPVNVHIWVGNYYIAIGYASTSIDRMGVTITFKSDNSDGTNVNSMEIETTEVINYILQKCPDLQPLIKFPPQNIPEDNEITEIGSVF